MAELLQAGQHPREVINSGQLAEKTAAVLHLVLNAFGRRNLNACGRT